MLSLKKIILTSIVMVFAHVAWGATSNGEPIRQIKTSEKVVALTFDDGPETFTPKILAVLKKHGVKATFYVLGGNAKAYPALIKQTMAEGHELGSHTMYHDKMKHKSVATIKKDLQQVDSILRNLGYQKEITFRAPYGITSPELKTVLRDMNKRMVLFTFLPQDWTKISSDQIYGNVMKELKPGLIITLHDGGKRRENTVIATDKLISELKTRGYRIVPISELLKLQES